MNGFTRVLAKVAFDAHCRFLGDLRSCCEAATYSVMDKRTDVLC